MNEEPQRPKVFQPKGSLAWQAMLWEAREIAKLPVLRWLVPGCISGFTIAVSLTYQFYFHVQVPMLGWVLFILAGPIFVLIILASTYLHYRFARPLSLSSNGLRTGWTSLGRRFCPVVDCRVDECSGTVPMFILSVYCKPPLSSRPRLAYCAITDDPVAAREFAAAFRERYPAVSEKNRLPLL